MVFGPPFNRVVLMQGIHPGVLTQSLRRGAQLLLLAAIVSCDGELPASPGTPTQPTPEVPPAPAAPASAPMAFSDSNIVLNAMSGSAPEAPIIVAVTARPGVSLANAAVVARYASGTATSWVSAQLDASFSPAKLTITGATSGLPAGEYSATVLLTAPGEEAQGVTVTARVVTAASIGLSAAKICFTTTLGGGNPHRDDVRIVSVDGSSLDQLSATVDYGEGQPTGWLTLSLDGTTAPTRLWLTPTVEGLSVGTYTATVLVASPAVGSGPVPIAVTLTVNPASLPDSRLDVSIQWEPAPFGGLATISGNGGLFCQGSGPSCSGRLQADVGSVGDITMVAEADYGAQFIRWEGACTGNQTTCTVNFPVAGTIKTATGVFGPAPSRVNMLLRGEGASGTVTVTPVTADGGGPLTCTLVDGVAQPGCAGLLEAGVGTVTLTATPAPGSVFVGWEVSAFNLDFPDAPTPCSTPTVSTCTLTFAYGGSTIDGFVNFARSP